LSDVWLTVHRAAHQIGGNCIEIATGDHRIVLDVGRPLDAQNDATGLLPTTLDLKAPMDGVLLSHPHQDHYGLLEETPRDWPLFCGEATKRLIRLTSGIFGKPIDRDFRRWTSGSPFEVGPFRITPHLTDHSAFDAHMSSRAILCPMERRWTAFCGSVSQRASFAVTGQRMTTTC
jgi:ribonuclease J